MDISILLSFIKYNSNDSHVEGFVANIIDFPSNRNEYNILFICLLCISSAV